MPNYRITAFDGLSLDTAVIYAKAGDVGGKKARVTLLYPPYSTPINTYGTGDAPTKYKLLDHTFLLKGDPDVVNTSLVAMEAKVGAQGVLSGRAGTTTGTCTAFLLNVDGEWLPPFKDGVTQWLEVSMKFQPISDWA
jgi:hypothetical protein